MSTGNMLTEKPTAFFYSALECFNTAVKNSDGTIYRMYNIAGHIIRMEFAGDALIPFITPAVEHLRINALEEPALRICLWDSMSTYSNMIPSPWGKEAFALHGHIPEYNTDRIYTIFQPGEDTLNMLDVQTDIAIFWRRNTHNIPFYTVGSPLRSIFHWWMHNNKRQMLHAAAVGYADGGVLIVGKGGSGKSTSALSCLDSDLLYVGDDYSLLSIEDRPYVYSLYSTAKLDVGHIKRFPSLVPLTHNQEPSEEDKYVILLHEHHPQKVVRGFPIKAVLAPRITGKKETTFKKCSATEVLTALAPSTIFQMSRGRTKSFETLTELVKKVPSYILECGNDIPQIPNAIREILSKSD